MKPGYKQTEVGVIPEEWATRPCSEISDRIMVGIVIRPTQYYVSQGVPAFRSANIREDGITDTDLVFISEASNALLAKSQTRVGDILTVRTGYPGTSAVVRPVHAGCNCIDILITRPSKKVDSDFLAIWINSSFGKEQVLRNQGGLAQKHFNVGDMRNLVAALPPVPEQRAIAEALSDVDALLVALDRLIAKKRDLKQAAMQELLTGQTRLPGFHGEWEVAVLGALLMMKATYGIVTAGDFKGTGVPMMRGGDIKGGRVGYDLPLVSPDKSIEYSRTILKRDDVVIALVGYPGEAAKVPSRLEGANISRAVGLLRLNKLIVPDFLVSYLNSPMGRRMVLAPSAGSAQLVVNLAELNKLEFPLPPLTEQSAIAEVLSDMDTELANLEQRREKTRALKQGMMQELLTGRTRLISPEPAHA